MESLPPGPSLPEIVQAVAYHRDPLGVLRRTRARFGPVFTLRFPLKSPLVFVSAPEALGALLLRMLVGHYEMVAMTLNSLGVQPDPPAPGQLPRSARLLQRIAGRGRR